MAAGDFNRDGRLDIAFTSNEETNFGGQIVVMKGNGDGTFSLLTSFWPNQLGGAREAATAPLPPRT